MAKIFNITTATENVNADVNGTAKASVTFTVTNVTDKPVRGVVHLQALERTQADWLSLDGEPEKDFPGGGTQQFTVVFTKPLQPIAEGQIEPEEKYPYRLNVASAVRPDEDFDEGPLVTIFKPERKGVKKGGGVPWWVFLIIGIVVLAALVVGLIFGLKACTGKAKKPVPDVTSKPTTVTDAKKMIEDAGFTTADPKEILAPEKKVGIVVAQEPAANEEALEGSEIKLTKPAEATIPQLKDSCVVAAMIELSNLGLKVNDDMVGDIADIQSCASKVLSTRPAERSLVAKGSFVTLTFNCVPKLNKPCRRINRGDILTTKATANERRAVESVFSGSVKR